MKSSTDELALRLASLRERVKAASPSADPPMIMAVTKRQPLELLQRATRVGILDFGENYAQHLAQRVAALADPTIRWHFIGQLQRNKVKSVLPLVNSIHTVDSERLITAIFKRIDLCKQALEIYIQVNFTGRDDRGGIGPNNLAKLLREIPVHDKLIVRGLMTVPPANEVPKPYFLRLAELRNQHRECLAEPYREAFTGLSMGMSGDFEQATAAGATILRLGTALFGARDA